MMAIENDSIYRMIEWDDFITFSKAYLITIDYHTNFSEHSKKNR